MLANRYFTRLLCERAAGAKSRLQERLRRARLGRDVEISHEGIALGSVQRVRAEIENVEISRRRTCERTRERVERDVPDAVPILAVHLVLAFGGEALCVFPEEDARAEEGLERHPAARVDDAPVRGSVLRLETVAQAGLKAVHDARRSVSPTRRALRRI